MSIRVWGAFKLNNGNMSVHELDNLSFRIVEIATQNHIGIRLGANVTNEFFKEYVGKYQYLPFEMVDNPRTNVAQVLFRGQGIEICEGNIRVDSGENLDSRMLRVQNFLQSVFTLGYIDNILFHIIGDFGEESIYEVKVHDFKLKMLELFIQENNWTPSIKLIINK